MQQLGSFDARTVEPSQGGGGAHPVGNGFPFSITNVEIKPNKENTGGMFNVEFTSPAGVLVNRYNLWNASPQAVEIARKELSALCHATGVFNINFDANGGKELVGAKGKMDVGFQKGHEPSPEKPAGGYVELKKVYDVNGNEPGKAPAPQQGNPNNAGFQNANQQPQGQAGAATQQGGSGWGTPPQNSQQANPNPPQGNGGAGAWQPGGNGGGAPAQNPPWGR